MLCGAGDRGGWVLGVWGLGVQSCECVPSSNPGVSNCNTFLTSCQLARWRTINYLDRQAPARLLEMNSYELINADIDLPRYRGRAPPR